MVCHHHQPIVLTAKQHERQLDLTKALADVPNKKHETRSIAVTAKQHKGRLYWSQSGNKDFKRYVEFLLPQTIAGWQYKAVQDKIFVLSRIGESGKWTEMKFELTKPPKNAEFDPSRRSGGYIYPSFKYLITIPAFERHVRTGGYDENRILNAP